LLVAYIEPVDVEASLAMVASVVVLYVTAAVVLEAADEVPPRVLFLADVLSGHNGHSLHQEEPYYNLRSADSIQGHEHHCDRDNWFATAAVAVLGVSMRAHH